VLQVIRDVRRYGTLTYNSCITTWQREQWAEISCCLSAGFDSYISVC